MKPERIREASVETVAGWDSLATVTLLSLVLEEFGVRPDIDSFEEFSSFQALLDYLRQAQASA